MGVRDRVRFNLEHSDARPWLYRIANNFVRDAPASTRRQHAAHDRWMRREAGTDELVLGVVDAIDVGVDLSRVAPALELQPLDEVKTLLVTDATDPSGRPAMAMTRHAIGVPGTSATYEDPRPVRCSRRRGRSRRPISRH